MATTKKATSAVGKKAPSKRRATMGTYQALVQAKGRYCKGGETADHVKIYASEYVKNAVKKGKTQAEAVKSANRVLRGGCSMSSAIAGKKKAPITAVKATRATAAKRRTTTAKRRTTAK